MPRGTGGRRRQKTLGEQFAAGVELRHPEQPPIIFEHPNVEKGYRNFDNILMAKCTGPIDWSEVNVIIPEIYQMTGSVNQMNQDQRAITRADNHYTNRQLELITQEIGGHF